MDISSIHTIYTPLYVKFDTSERLKNAQVFLAHYTSVSVMQKIIDTAEVWFSNPLFMSDLEELRFGLFEGARIFSEPQILKRASGSDARSLMLEAAFTTYHTGYQNEGAFDTYVFCMSEHDHDDDDGLLSMWRGYGGQGKGAALIFDTQKLTWIEGSPLIVTAVAYADSFRRVAELENILFDWATITASANIPDNLLHVASYNAFSLILTYALITKHIGFSEEREWRIVYVPYLDPRNLLHQYFGYEITSRGVEPKLKYQVGSLAGVSAPDLSVDRLLYKIILGPSLSSPLAVRSVQRMFEKMGKSQYSERLRASKIPFRPIEGG